MKTTAIKINGVSLFDAKKKKTKVAKCPECGYTEPLRKGIPPKDIKCPNCDNPFMEEVSDSLIEATKQITKELSKIKGVKIEGNFIVVESKPLTATVEKVLEKIGMEEYISGWSQEKKDGKIQWVNVILNPDYIDA